MAPTLLGRHKEVTCPECGLVYAVDGNREIEGPRAQDGSSVRIEGGVCVNCRLPARIGDEPNFQGDRIYVIKTPLNIPFVPALGTARPKRWDVAVFKLPEDPEVRYIKRMAGMPGEVLRILRGDVWVKPLGARDDQFRRPLRPLAHQDAMQILVFDDRLRPRSLRDDPRWARWAPRTPGAWEERPGEPGVYRATGSGGQWSALRYRHVVPDPAQWAAVLQRRPLPEPPRATLITDFYSYNTELTNETAAHPMMASKPWRQAHWVGDLTLSGTLEVTKPAGLLRVELVKAGVTNRCEVDLATDRASLYHGETLVAGPVPAGLGRPGRHAFRFANVDDRLTLRVDGALPFGEGVSFDPGDAITPDAADLDPVGIASNGAAVAVSDLVLTRDIYYTLQPGRADYDSLELEDPLPSDPVAIFDWLADPNKFAAFGKLGPRDYPIAPRRYMMLGDNSPWSRDGRDWRRIDQVDPAHPGQGWDDSGRETWEVPEALLVGKAFCVYWPHLKPFWPALRFSRDVRLPARPNLESMRWVR
jgi:signal peptidase I